MLCEKSLKIEQRLGQSEKSAKSTSGWPEQRTLRVVKSGEMGLGPAALRCFGRFGRDEEGTSRGLKRPRGRLASTSLRRRTNHLGHHLHLPLAFLTWTTDNPTPILCDLIGFFFMDGIRYHLHAIVRQGINPSVLSSI